MIVTYMRSSSYGAWSLCPAQYTYSYVLGIRDPGNIKAARGNVVHKALELLAHKKLCLQEGRAKFTEDESGREFDVDSLTPEECFEFGWEHYSTRDSHLDWSEQYDWCKDLFFEQLAQHDGMWNPMNRDIVAPEKYFDMVIDEPWAKYKYTLPDGTPLEGQLAIKGTVDLLTRLSDDTFEYIDWKTGMRLDWATGEVKDYKKLRNDPQLRMYYYAITKMYPEIKYVIMSISFIQGGEVVKSTRAKKGIPNRGVFSMPYGPEDIAPTLEMLKNRFQTIKACSIPKKRVTWKCKSFCFFGKNNWKTKVGEDEEGKPIFEDSGKTICNFLHDEMRVKGLNRVIMEYGDQSKISNYGSGGGRSDVK